jgi:signal peptidase I
MNFLKNRYFKFGIAATAYILWVIWVGNYWLLFGLAIVFDIYVSKKVNWAFWKKRHGPNSTFIEWLDALIFAVIAVTFINIFFFQ